MNGLLRKSQTKKLKLIKSTMCTNKVQYYDLVNMKIYFGVLFKEITLAIQALNEVIIKVQNNSSSIKVCFL